MKHLFRYIYFVILLVSLGACQKEDTMKMQQDTAIILGTYNLKESCLLPTSTNNKIPELSDEIWTIIPFKTTDNKVYFQELGVFGIVNGTSIEIPSQLHEGLKMRIAGHGEVINRELHLYYTLTDHILQYSKICEVHGLKSKFSFLD